MEVMLALEAITQEFPELVKIQFSTNASSEAMDTIDEFAVVKLL